MIMHKNAENLVGQKFGRWTVVEQAESDKRRNGRHKCVCECGTEKVILSFNLKMGKTKSCGCYRVESGRVSGYKARTHGMSRSPTHKTWEAMKSRCLNINNPKYQYYGLQGVEVCEKWMDFEGFLADMGERPEGLSLDRINPFGNYEKENCRWADVKTQRQNTRRHAMKESLLCLR